MRKILFSILMCFSAVFVTSTNSNAQSKLIHYWHFNNYTLSQYTDTIQGIAADYSSLDTAKAKILYKKNTGTSMYYKTYIDSYTVIAATDFDTVNLRMGATAGSAMRTRNPSDSMKLYFYIPTTHYKNIKLTYASQSSSVTKGQLHHVYDYSVDSGATWKTTGLSMPSDSAWLVFHRSTVTFTTDTTVNNNPKLIFRITFNGNDTFLTKGNNRFDNVTVEGDTVTTSGGSGVSVVNVYAEYQLYPNPVANVLHISSEIDGAKNISIVNVAGKEVIATIANSKLFNVDVAQLQAGIYFINVKNTTTGVTSSMQFIKQ